MKSAPLDTTGFTLSRAREILARDSAAKREVVVRQTVGENGTIELVVAEVWAIAGEETTANDA
jgi:hypothetical protein